MKKKPIPDSFKLINDHIDVFSSSGKKYTITLGHCTCIGFGFHRDCRHYQEAEEDGLISKLKTSIKTFSIKLSDHARLMRKNALRQFLTKNNISFTEQLIDKLEPSITSIGSEISEGYCRIAEERIHALRSSAQNTMEICHTAPNTRSLKNAQLAMEL
jgi:hypothetical protein